MENLSIHWEMLTAIVRMLQLVKNANLSHFIASLNNIFMFMLLSRSMTGSLVFTGLLTSSSHFKMQYYAVVSKSRLREFHFTHRNASNESSQHWAHLCWVPPAFLQHDQTLQSLYVQVCREIKTLVEWRGFCLFCPASSPLLCNLEPGPLEMSEGGTLHGTLPSLPPLEIQWKDSVVVKQT